MEIPRDFSDTRAVKTDTIAYPDDMAHSTLIFGAVHNDCCISSFVLHPIHVTHHTSTASSASAGLRGF